MSQPGARERLLQAATDLFVAQGVGAVSMDLVRQHAGVSNGSLYHHFPTRQQLIGALYAEVLVDYQRTLLARLQQARDAETGVKALVGAHIDWVLAAPGKARLLHELRRGDALPAGDAPWAAPNADAFAALARWTAAHVATGALRALPLRVWNALVFAPVLSLTPHWLAGDPPQVDALVREALAEGAWRAVSPVAQDATPRRQRGTP
jgi:AcrR family transcriptional regulator